VDVSPRVVLLSGSVHIWTRRRADERETAEGTSTVALIQQNTDPRKNDYEEGLTILKKLTDRALKYDPDLVSWSETAFVPNIRRWSKYEPREGTYPRLVHEFLEYQRQTGTWLLTGNDDYFLRTNEEGNEVRDNFNAAILFSPEGERVETYHKVHLVPFTEYFPYKEQLPGLYEFLINWDVNLWTPGTEYVVFEHPDFTFCTPICFEDSFPGDIRQFVREGADVILNISNDFWSLTEVEAKQHYVNSLFRAIENRRHLLRATASGLTAHVTPEGRLAGSLPYYEEGYLISEVPRAVRRASIYSVLGDWFVYLCGGIAFMALVLQIRRLYRKRGELPGT
jgi:apolipoprotein N-acyltransferase